jgi:LPS O-antigen subunit length determinant protein (WzzB/FepE family)
MRDAEKKQTSKSIKFLNEQALTVNYEEIKIAISLLQQEQMKSLMLIEANEDYIFKIVESPLVPEMKSGPNRFVIVLIGALFGAILSILFLVINFFTKR